MGGVVSLRVTLPVSQEGTEGLSAPRLGEGGSG